MPLFMLKSERGRVAVWLAGALVITGFLIWLFPQYSLGFASRVLTVDQPPQRSDAVVVLLGGDGPRRILKAYSLYREGRAPLILFGSGFLDTEDLKGAPPGFVWLPSSANYEAAMISLKVPRQHYVVVDTKLNFDTAAELKSIASYLRSRGARSVILVTSRAHTRRVELIWTRVAPDIGHFTVSAPAPELDEWWRSNRAAHAVAYEFAGLLKESFRQFVHFTGLD